MDWHGYILLQKPAALSLTQWRACMLALAQRLGLRDNDGQPANRMQVRRRLDDGAVLLEACFDTDDLDISQTARGIVSILFDALAGAYTRAQIKTALTNNVTRWGGDWEQSRQQASAYLAANAAAWGDV
jgi:hypothetical protein